MSNNGNRGRGEGRALCCRVDDFGLKAPWGLVWGMGVLISWKNAFGRFVIKFFHFVDVCFVGDSYVKLEKIVQSVRSDVEVLCSVFDALINLCNG